MPLELRFPKNYKGPKYQTPKTLSPDLNIPKNPSNLKPVSNSQLNGCPKHQSPTTKPPTKLNSKNPKFQKRNPQINTQTYPTP